MYITIFVEGNEVLFVKNLIQKIAPKVKDDNIKIDALGPQLKDEICVNIIKTGGFTNLELNQKYFEQTMKKDGACLVIFDADNETTDYGGFTARIRYLEEKKKLLGIEFEVYLFPDNKRNGAYENLLEDMIREDHRGLLDCFNAYQECVSHKGASVGKIYNMPLNKSKIYSCIDAIVKSKSEEDRFKKRKKKDEDFLFEREDIWNYSNPSVLPLIAFLLKYLK